jgi:hypothetical protein
MANEPQRQSQSPPPINNRTQPPQKEDLSGPPPPPNIPMEPAAQPPAPQKPPVFVPVKPPAQTFSTPQQRQPQQPSPPNSSAQSPYKEHAYIPRPSSIPSSPVLPTKPQVLSPSIKPAGQRFSVSLDKDSYKESMRPQLTPFRPEQKKDLLTRSEVRTMQKEIGSLRELEVQKERERISQLKSQEELEKEREAVKKIRQAAELTKHQEETSRKNQLQKIQDSILPPGEERRVQNLAKKPSLSKKVFVRIIVVVIFAFIALNLVLFA